MKKIVALILLILVLTFASCDSGKDTEVKLDPINGTVEIYSYEGLKEKQTYEVYVSGDGDTWNKVPVYQVNTGHQLGDKLLPQTGATFFGIPNTNSMCLFDFTGTIGVRIECSNEFDSYVLSPTSYGMKSIREDNIITFTVTQSEDPRKVTFRPSNKWDSEVLHILTNDIEESINKEDANVYVINPGDTIPRYLPEGYDTYYFSKGVHTLPGGYWVEMDLGSSINVKSFTIKTPKLGNTLTGGLCYRLEAYINDTWTKVYEVTGEDAEYNYTGSKDTSKLSNVSIDATAQKFRLILLGNYNPAPINNYVYVNSSWIYEISLFNANGDCVSKNTAVNGSEDNFSIATDGKDNLLYGNMYAKEAFYIPSNTKVYLEAGAHVYGCFGAVKKENISILGRGVLDCSRLENELTLYEGRSSGIRFYTCKNITISGITMMDSPMWMCIVNESENVLVDGVNLFGWSTNADGIHFSASKNATATGCFIRTTDDIFVAYHYGDSNNLTFKNSVCWEDGGRILLLGLADKGTIDTVTMENIDVIASQNVYDVYEHGGVIHIVASGGQTIKNVTCKDIRIEEVRCPKITPLLELRCGNTLYSSGNIEGVLLENISYASANPYISLMDNVIVGGHINGVIFTNVSIHGDLITYKNIYKLIEVGDEVEFDIQNK